MERSGSSELGLILVLALFNYGFGAIASELPSFPMLIGVAIGMGVPFLSMKNGLHGQTVSAGRLFGLYFLLVLQVAFLVLAAAFPYQGLWFIKLVLVGIPFVGFSATNDWSISGIKVEARTKQ